MGVREFAGELDAVAPNQASQRAVREFTGELDPLARAPVGREFTGELDPPHDAPQLIEPSTAELERAQRPATMTVSRSGRRTFQDIPAAPLPPPAAPAARAAVPAPTIAAPSSSTRPATMTRTRTGGRVFHDIPAPAPTAADIEQSLTAQEREIVNYHRGNRANPGRDAQGRPVTVYSTGIQIQDGPYRGRFVSVPGFVDGQIVEDEGVLYQRWKADIDAGRWPMYGSGEELNRRSREIHQIMDAESEPPPAAWGDVLESLPGQFVAGARQAGANLRRMSANEAALQRESALGIALGASEPPTVDTFAQTQGGAVTGITRGRAVTRQQQLLERDRARSAQATADEALAERDLQLVTPPNMNIPQKAVSSLAQSAAPTLAGIGVGIVTRNPWLAMSIAGGGGGAMQGASTYGAAYDKGRGHRQSAVAMTIDAILEGVGEALPLSFALKQGTPIATRIFTTMVAEAGQEAATQVMQDLHAYLNWNPEITLGEAWENLQVAALAGAAGGAVYGSMGHAMNRTPGQEIGAAMQEGVDAMQVNPGAVDAEARARMDPAGAQMTMQPGGAGQPGPDALQAAADAHLQQPEITAANAQRAELEALLADPRPFEQIESERQAAAQAETRAQEEAAQSESAAQAQALAQQIGVEIGARAIVQLRGADPVAGTVLDYSSLEDDGWSMRFRADDGELYAVEGNDNAVIRPEPAGDGTRAAPLKVADGRDLTLAEQHVDPNPTPGQKEHENFRMGHVKFYGPDEKAPLDISIETARGGTRTAKDGSWSVPDFPASYGRIKGSTGADGDHVDVFIGQEAKSDFVAVIDQIDPDTLRFDEHKVFVGFNNVDEVVDVYRRAFTDGRADDRLGALTEQSLGQLKGWLKSGDTKRAMRYVEPRAEEITIDEAEVNLEPIEATDGSARTEPTDYTTIDTTETMDDEPVSESPQTEEPAQPAAEEVGAARARALDELATEAVAPERQPWEMTRDQYVASFKGQRVKKTGFQNRLGSLRSAHREAVEGALQLGRPVPSEVLADYPELQSTTSQVRTLSALARGVESEPPVGGAPDEQRTPKADATDTGVAGGDRRLRRIVGEDATESIGTPTPLPAERTQSAAVPGGNKGESARGEVERTQVATPAVESAVREPIQGSEPQGANVELAADSQVKEMRRGEFIEPPYTANADRPFRNVRRGPQALVERLELELRMRERAHARGDTRKALMDREQVEEIRAFIRWVGEHMVDDVAMSVRVIPGPWGNFNPAQRLVTIFEGAISDGELTRTTIHEIWHSLESVVTREDRRLLRIDFERALGKYVEAHPHVRPFLSSEGLSNRMLSGELARQYVKQHPEAPADVSYFKDAGVQKVRLRATPENYRFTNASEYWAEGLTDRYLEDLSTREEISAYYDLSMPGRALLRIGREMVRRIVSWIKQRFGRDQLDRIFRGFATRAYAPAHRNAFQADLELDDIVMVNGVERPINNSEGQQIAYTRPVRETFWRWFGDSKVVDDDGRPRVVYHGTRRSFTRFSEDEIGEGFDSIVNMGDFGDGFYFTPDRTEASGYAERARSEGEPRVMAVYLALQNPADIDQLTRDNPEIAGMLQDPYPGESLRKRLEAMGYDGIVANGGREVVAFRPEQIKSATENRGTFDPADQDIRNMERDALPPLPEPRSLEDIAEDAERSLRSDGPKPPNGLDRIFNDREMRWMGMPDMLKRVAVHPRTIASIDRAFTPVYKTAVQQFERRDEIAAELGRIIQPYFDLPQDGKQKVNAVLELGRLQGEIYGRGKAPVVATNETAKEAVLSKPGETVTLTDAEKSAYWAVRRAMSQALKRFKVQLIEDMGEDSKILDSSAKIIEAAEAVGDRARATRMRALANIVQEVEQADRLGYVPFSRWGQVGITVKQADESVGWGPSTVHYEMVEIDDIVSRARRAVKIPTRELRSYPKVVERVQALQKQYPDADINVFQLSDKSPLGQVQLADLDALAEVAKIDNKTWDEVRDQLSTAMKQRGFRKHFFGSRNVPGYSVDFERSLADYVVGIAGYLARRRYASQWDEAIDNVSGTRPKLRKYAQAYREYVNDPVEELATLRATAFIYYLAGSPATAMVNMTQVPLITAPYLMQFTSPAQVTVHLTRAYKDAMAMMPAEALAGAVAGAAAGGVAGGPVAGVAGAAIGAIYAGSAKRGMHKLFDPSKAPADVREAFQKAWDQGFFVPLNVYEMMGLAHNRTPLMRGLSKKTKAAADTVALMFAEAERLNRIVTFIAAYRVAQLKGVKQAARDVLSKDSLAQVDVLKAFSPEAFAEWVIDETHYRMGKVNRPSMMRSYGTAVLQFKGFILQTIELHYRVSRMHGPRGKAAFGAMMALLVITAGLWGLPFADDLRDLIEALYKRMNEIDLDLKTELAELAKEITGSARLAEVMSQGALRASGVDVSSRIGQGDILPDTGLEAAGVSVDLTWGRATQAMEFQFRGQSLLALAELLPNFIRNPITGADWGDDGVRSKGSGKVVIPQEEITPSDVVLKGLGFTPADIARTRERLYAEQRSDRASDELRRNYYSKLATAEARLARAEDRRDTQTIAKLQKEIDALYDEIDQHNESHADHLMVKIHKPTLKRLIAQEIEGAAVQKGRKQARGRREELREIYGR